MEVEESSQSPKQSQPWPIEATPLDRRFSALGDLRVLPDEILCAILTYLSPRDVARVACVSSVLYIFCNEEPLWLSLCLNNLQHPLQYKGSWKKTTMHQMDLPIESDILCQKPLRFDGFNSLFLYRRLYRCYTTLNGFAFDNGNVERSKNLSLEEFHDKYDGQKPVLIAGLADSWPASNTWTTEQLVLKYGDTTFKISQRSPRKITMKLKDYVSYTQLQRDEDPLYIFDEKFGEVAPGLLEDYSVPHLFQEDFFDVLDREQRPPYRWLIIGPERSGASWHVDPALTSAWNTLLCGRKRWALYPPGRVPAGVTVHVNEEDGDVNIDTPSSLQWWLDFYPLLADEDKPIECTQHPGETIFVPSGWWHCVLNLETTIAVTQNFVNSKNFEFVCLDMAPGYRHKGVCRAGLLALDEDVIEDVRMNIQSAENNFSYSDLSRKEKRTKVPQHIEDSDCETARNVDPEFNDTSNLEFSYDINFLAMFLDKERDHYNSLWSLSNCIGQREMREWLSRLWHRRPVLRDLIWKGACIALNSSIWFECMEEICAYHELPLPTEDERLPVGTGSNPVYLVSNNVIKILVEGGLEASLHSLGTELEFYSTLQKVNSPLKEHIPDVLASGILYIENGLCRIVPWDGKDVPEVISNSVPLLGKHRLGDYPYGIWSKGQFEYKKAGMSPHELETSNNLKVWPYVVTRRCRGKIFADLRETLSWEETLSLASFLGEQLRNLHLVPYPSLNFSALLGSDEETVLPQSNGCVGLLGNDSIPVEWDLFIKTLNKKKEDVSNRLMKWGDPIPVALIEKVSEYLPDNLAKLLFVSEDTVGVDKSCTWIHSDIMDDNIHMELSCPTSCSAENSNSTNGDHSEQKSSWFATHILDFSNLSIGDPLLDLIPIYLDMFRGDSRLLKHFLESYKLPLLGRQNLNGVAADNSKCARLSYQAMCYCILHDDNVLGAIFSIWKELKKAKSWEEVEETVWGDLNSYMGSY
nr:F-box protein At1g78280 [Ipomoea batatas]